MHMPLANFLFLGYVNYWLNCVLSLMAIATNFRTGKAYLLCFLFYNASPRDYYKINHSFQFYFFDSYCCVRVILFLRLEIKF